MYNENLILASASPRRIEMMRQKGLDPRIVPAKIDEALPFPMDMESAVMFLACKKALWVENTLTAAELDTAPMIIAADTVVYKDKIIGKPKSQQETIEILTTLRSSSHYVVTGVCLLRAGTPIRTLFYEVTEVFFKDYTEKELLAYAQTSEPYDKAGGYAIQGTFGKYVDHIEGDRENVIGFPWGRIEKELEKLKRSK